MNAKDKTEDVLKSIHILFSKAEPLEGSKKKVIIDKEKMMRLLKELNDCMYSMMDEYEITRQSKERALRDMQKQSDAIAFDARKNAEDIYAASIMYTDHALNEVQDLVDKTRDKIKEIQESIDKELESSKQTIKDNQIELKNNLSGLIDSQKYLMLIENENKRLKREAEKNGDSNIWEDTPKEKIVPKININEEYFKVVGLDPNAYNNEKDDDVSDEAVSNLSEEEIAKLDEEYFEWKDKEEESGDKVEPLKKFFGFGRKQS